MRSFMAYNGDNALIRVFDKTLKSVLSGRWIAASGIAAKKRSQYISYRRSGGLL
jgi:hypothetical protein